MARVIGSFKCCTVALLVGLSTGLLTIRPSLSQVQERAVAWESILERDGKVCGKMSWVNCHPQLLVPYLEFVLYDDEGATRVTGQLVGGKWHKPEDQETWLRVLSKLTLMGGQPYLDDLFHGEETRAVCYRVDAGVGLMFFDQHWSVLASLGLPKGEPCLVFYDEDERFLAKLELVLGELHLSFRHNGEAVRAKLEPVEGERALQFCEEEKAFPAVLSLAGQESYFGFYDRAGKTRLTLPRLRELGLHELAFFDKSGNLAFCAP